MLKPINMNKMKVTQLQNNQFEIRTKNEIIFQSYNTIVARITNFENGNEPVIELQKGQPQSKTTAKYLNKFLSNNTNIDNYKKLTTYKEVELNE